MTTGRINQGTNIKHHGTCVHPYTLLRARGCVKSKLHTLVCLWVCKPCTIVVCIHIQFFISHHAQKLSTGHYSCAYLIDMRTDQRQDSAFTWKSCMSQREENTIFLSLSLTHTHTRDRQCHTQWETHTHAAVYSSYSRGCPCPSNARKDRLTFLASSHTSDKQHHLFCSSYRESQFVHE